MGWKPERPRVTFAPSVAPGPASLVAGLALPAKPAGGLLRAVGGTERQEQPGVPAFSFGILGAANGMGLAATTSRPAAAAAAAAAGSAVTGRQEAFAAAASTAVGATGKPAVPSNSRTAAPGAGVAAASPPVFQKAAAAAEGSHSPPVFQFGGRSMQRLRVAAAEPIPAVASNGLSIPQFAFGKRAAKATPTGKGAEAQQVRPCGAVLVCQAAWAREVCRKTGCHACPWP